MVVKAPPEAGRCRSTRRDWLRLAGALLAAGPAGGAWAATAGGGRYVTTDWAAAECLLALGVTPLAICEPDLYRQWLPELPLPESVLDLGSRVEPNLERLAALRPDRIFLSNWQRSTEPLLRRIAPTQIVTVIAARTDPYENARTSLEKVAELVGRSDRARDYLRHVDTSFERFQRALTIHAHPPVYVGVLHENGAQVFVYGKGSWVDVVLARLGLRNALTRPTSPFGNALLDLAQFAEREDATLLYLDQGERTRRAERRLRASSLWQGLPMVRDGRIRTIPAFFALGAAPSMLLCARVLTEALLALPGAPGG